jgi:BlaI family penicillinase repressor
MPAENLPDAELEVVSCLWKHGDLTARQLREHLHKSRPLSHSAVSTLLQRLQDKKMVTRRKAPTGKAFIYRAVGKSQKAGRRLADGILHRVFGDDPLAIVSSLFETRKPTADELNQLQQLLNRLRQDSSTDGESE